MEFETLFMKSNPKYGHVLGMMREAIGTHEVRWSDLTTSNLVSCRDYMLERCANNSVITYCAVLKAFLNVYKDDDIVPCKDVAKALKVKRQPSQNIALTEQEMALIESYEPKTDTERDIKARFLCEYYSMARSCDINALTEENIANGHITYVSIKTSVATTVPLHAKFMKYFNERGKEHNRAVFNTTIKAICKACGIDDEIKIFYRGKERVMKKYELVGSHTARRSAITALALRDVPLNVIAKLANHTNTAMTDRYVCVDTTQLDNNVMAFFQ